MGRLMVVTSAVFVVSIIVATCAGGGEDFHVPILVAAGDPMRQAATGAQLMLFLAGVAPLFCGMRGVTQ